MDTDTEKSYGVSLPETHGYSKTTGYDQGGKYVEWYADDDGGSGLGNAPFIQRWYVTDESPAPELPPPEGWVPFLDLRLP